jgi:hypothetical protein
MLFEFHRRETSRKPGSVHATYLITGQKAIQTAPYANGASKQDGEDTFMQSSPFMSSSAQQQEPVHEEDPVVETQATINLVPEEHLEGLVCVRLAPGLLAYMQRRSESRIPRDIIHTSVQLRAMPNEGQNCGATQSLLIYINTP